MFPILFCVLAANPSDWQVDYQDERETIVVNIHTDQCYVRKAGHREWVHDPVATRIHIRHGLRPIWSSKADGVWKWRKLRMNGTERDWDVKLDGPMPRPIQRVADEYPLLSNPKNLADEYLK